MKEKLYKKGALTPFKGDALFLIPFLVFSLPGVECILVVFFKKER